MKKVSPSLPSSSRMMMPSTGGSTSKISSKKSGVSKRIISSASGKGMKGSNPY